MVITNKLFVNALARIGVSTHYLFTNDYLISRLEPAFSLDGGRGRGGVVTQTSGILMFY